MAQMKDFFSRIKIEYRPSRPLTKMVAVAAIVFSMLALLTLRWAQNDVRNQTRDMMAEAARLEQENARLEQKLDDLGTVQGVEQVAKEELDLVDPDTVIIETE